MSERCFCFFSVKDSGRISEHSLSQGAYKKPVSLDIYPGETGRPSKVILFSTWKNVLSVLPCSVISPHRDQHSTQISQTPSNLTVGFLDLLSFKYCTLGQFFFLYFLHLFLFSLKEVVAQPVFNIIVY